VAPLLEMARIDLATTRSELTRAVERGVTEELRSRGLAEALRELGERAGAVTDVRLAGLDVNADAVAALWFCASEALANALKHAGPARVALNARVVDGALVLEVVDDGPGGTNPDGRGLLNLRRRAEGVGGNLTVQSPPGGGTRVTVSVPVARDGRSTGSLPRR
jgi:signal transduction histidine kinase